MFEFLLAELMMFGGLLCSYLAYRTLYYPLFQEPSKHMALVIGVGRSGAT